MIRQIFWAKNKGIESIEEHTNRLLVLFDAFLLLYKDKFTEEDILLIKEAIIYHDLGKMNSAFQSYLYKRAGKSVPNEFTDLEPYKYLVGKDIPHGILSGAFINPKLYKEKGLNEDDISVLVTAICNHHSRSLEFDYQANIKTLEKVIIKDLNKRATTYGLNFCAINAIRKYNKLINAYQDFSSSLWARFALVKGILNKMDYAASAHNAVTEYEPDDAHKNVKEAFCSLGYKLRECQEYLLNKKHENIIMTASTGMGKTEAALMWASNDKTFYTLPYKVSINAIFQRLREQKYYDKDKLVLLHSDALSILMNYEDELQEADYNLDEIKRKYEQIRNFSFPFTICTVDQLFLFSLRPLGTELITATLSYSKIIIDEIQAYEPKLLAKILYGLYLIDKLNGRFMIMTATLPPFIKDFFIEKNIKHISTPPFFSQKLRHKLRIDGKEFEYNSIIQAAKTKKVLVICNTVARAQHVFSCIKDNYKGIIHLLHSRFILKDRKEKERAILSFAPNNEELRKSNCTTLASGIWVTTQLVEASLDIDFDILFTEMSTADSLLQRMGRCYRNREYKESKPNIIVYDTCNGIDIIYDKEIYERSLAKLLPYQGIFFCENDKQRYIEEVYNTHEIKNTKYYKTFNKELGELENLKHCFLKKKDAQKVFRDIETISVIPYQYADAARKIEDQLLQLTINSKEEMAREISSLKNKLRDFTLSINPNSRKYKISKEKIIDYLICNNEYDNLQGLIDYEETNNFF